MGKNVAVPKATDINGNLFNSFNRLCFTLPKPDIFVDLLFLGGHFWFAVVN